MNASHLIERNTRAHTVDGYTAAHMVQSAHESTIRELVAELNTLKGVGACPQAGCLFFIKPFGAISATVEVEIEAGQREIIRADPDDCQEGFDPSVNVLRIFLNGVWCDAADVVPDSILERWETEVLESISERDEAAAESAAESLAEMRRDWSHEVEA